MLQSGTQKNYLYYENKSGSRYDRRCIDGRITGCGNCVGYCEFHGHSGFLTAEQRRKHSCIEKGCHYYLPKVKQEKLKKEVDQRPGEIVSIASALISTLEGMRIMKADREPSGGWLVKYISITNGYSIDAIEYDISTAVGEAITLVKLHYDFERAAQLIFQ